MTSDDHSPPAAANRSAAWPVLSLLYAATFWGTLWYPLRLLEDAGLSGLWQTLVSFSSAALLMLPLLLRRRAWRALPHPGWLALLAVAAGWANVAFVLAVIQGEVVRVLLLFYLSPLWAAVLGWLMLGERLQPSTWLTVPAGLLGAMAMLWEPGLGMPWPPTEADWLAITAGVAFALANVSTRRMEWVSIRLRTFTAWVGVVAIALVLVVGEELAVPAASSMAWSGAVLLGLLGFFTCTMATIYGVSHMPVQRSSVIMLFEIVAGGLSAWLIAGEAMGMQEWIGGGLILSAGLLAATRR